VNKVLVVLTVSALFAGTMDAAMRGSKKRAPRKAAMAQVEISKLGFFELVQKHGEEEFNEGIMWSKEMRKQALTDQYGSIDKAPKALVTFLIGSPANDTKRFRMRYKEAALKVLASKAIAETTKQVNELAKEEQTPAVQAELQQKTGLLAGMSETFNKYVPASAITAAKVVIGAAVVAVVTYGSTYAVDIAAQKLGYEGGYGAALRGYTSATAGEIATYVQTSRPYGWASSAASTVGGALMKYPMQAYGAYSALRGQGTPAAQPTVNAPTVNTPVKPNAGQ